MKLKPILALFALSLAPSAWGDTPEQNFLINCSACHAVDHKLVGPSLVEISTIYGKDRDGFLKWCLKPGKKRPETIEMPSMAHVGEPTLKEIYSYILTAAAGKTEQVVPDNPALQESNRRPRVQRIFMPEASPAAIAVAMPGDLSYCFDAGECRLRYVWKGGFIDGLDYYKGNGNSLAVVKGDVVYREKEFPLDGAGNGSKPKFLGYTLSDGLPVFHYLRGGVEFTEKITPTSEGDGVVREFHISGVPSVELSAPQPGVKVTVKPAATPTPSTFTATYRWK